MITSIKRIEHLGLLFSDYTSQANLPPFKQFNIIYGWNGSGKTTLSRLFDAVGGNHIENLQYQLEGSDGNTYEQHHSFPQRIRVFNRDYIEANVGLVTGKARTISLIVGAENKKLLQEIEKDQQLLDGELKDNTSVGKRRQLADAIKDCNQKASERDALFTAIAKTIGTAIGGNALRDYRRPQAIDAFALLEQKALLSDQDLAESTAAVHQKLLPELPLLTLPVYAVSPDATPRPVMDVLNTILDTGDKLLRRTVQSESLKRLAANDDIALWVEQGVALHKAHASTSCEYCLQHIPEQRLDELARHFNEEDKLLKSDIDRLLHHLNAITLLIRDVQFPDKARFYDNLQSRAESSRQAINKAMASLLDSIGTLMDELRTKKIRTTQALSLKSAVDSTTLPNAVTSANRVIGDHNGTTLSLDKIKQTEIKKLTAHHLSTIYDAVKSLDTDITKLTSQRDKLKGEIAAIESRIGANMATVSSDHKACDLLTQHLSTFLGHSELTFRPDLETKEGANGVTSETVTGYRVFRGDEPATYLSEGEKSAIAFVYFVVHLTDRDFRVQDGIVVVDDPVSSLDSNSLYQAFAFLKAAMRDAKQVFILTHDFDFLKLLLNWRTAAAKADTAFLMINNRIVNGARAAFIEQMDKELHEYESEYHYLFKLLKRMRSDQDGTISMAYPVPNIARKVWDTFLMFRVPSGKTPYRKMEDLKADGHDAQKLDAIYKFTNDQSHITGAGFNPALVPETRKALDSIFEMMEKTAPDHFKIIDQATN